MKAAELADFISTRMRMSHIYRCVTARWSRDKALKEGLDDALDDRTVDSRTDEEILNGSPKNDEARRTHMTATEQLRHEHEAITLVLSILEKLCQRLANSEEVNPQHFGQVLEFIQVFADQCHHGKEEQFLFPALEAAGIPKAGGPLGVMLSEHEHGRALIRQLAAAWQKHCSGDRAAAAVVIASARDYSAFLNAHIFKENNILFPMAEARLSADTQRRLLEEFERLEIERIGAGKHEQFHKTLDFLKKTYLG